MTGMIYYDTKYGSTRAVCESVRKGLGFRTEISNVKNPKGFEYDVIIIGSPVFIGRPMRSVTNFIRENRESLIQKNLALFVTCWAAATRYFGASNEFLDLLKKELVSCNLIGCKALPGKLIINDLGERDKKALGRLLRRIDSMADNFHSREIKWRDARDFNSSESFGRDIRDKLVNNDRLINGFNVNTGQ